MKFMLGEELETKWPNTVRTLHKLVKAADSCVKNVGKKTIFGKDKFHNSKRKFLYVLALTIDAMIEDGIIRPSTSTEEIILELKDKIILFNFAYPYEHTLAHELFSYYFRESKDLLVDEINILLHRPKAKSREDYSPRDENKLGQAQLNEMEEMFPAKKDSLWIKRYYSEKNYYSENSTKKAASSVSQKPIITKETFANGDVYEGEHKDGKQHGQGKKVFVKGDLYLGEWKDGLQNGQGTYTFANGDVFEGEFKDGKPWNVKGYDKNGIVLVGYVKGKLKK